MKKTIYLLSILVLFICAGCGSDEPDDAGNIACQAYIKNEKGSTEMVDAVFFLFEGTGYTSIDMDTYESFPIQKIKAVRGSEKVENIGWCTCSKESSGLIVPVYSATDKDMLERTQAGTFTIVCLMSYRFDYYSAYMMKTFSKKRNDPVLVNATFLYSDFSKTNTAKIQWRE